MKTFICIYLNHNDDSPRACTLHTHHRLDAITEFEELYPKRVLVGVKTLEEYRKMEVKQ